MDITQLQQILNAIAAAARIAGGLGIPVAGLVGSLIPIFNELLASITARTGKTRAEIIADTDTGLSAELLALMESDAKGE